LAERHHGDGRLPHGAAPGAADDRRRPTTLRHRLAERLRVLADRSGDRLPERPADVVYALDEQPPPAQVFGLALQQIAIQSVYFLLPGIVGSAFGLHPSEVTRFLCLSVVALGLTALAQAATRGPIGSGYGLPSIPSPVFVAVYLLVAETGDLLLAGVLTAAAGALGLVLAVSVRGGRLQALVPTEVAGVVVFLIGVSLLPRALGALAAEELPEARRLPAALVALATLAVMVVVALTRGWLGRFGVLIGAALGGVLALSLGLSQEGASALLAQEPWFALPTPKPPPPAAFDPALLPAFVLALLASFASWTGDLLAFQRAADGAWRRPDPAPVRRGLAAQSLGLVAAGMLGGMAPASSSACVGLAIATKTLSRAVAVVGAAMLLLLACMPKLVALFVLVPDPVKAAMLGYVCCFMLAAGCQLTTVRMLDTRRIFTVGLGLCAGFAALIAPELLARLGLPRALAAPVTTGALVAAALNLLTAPLVSRRAALAVRTEPGMHQVVVDACEALGGAWGARRETMDRVKHSLLELGELLAARGVVAFEVQARFEDEAVRLLVSYRGEPLPRPAARPEAGDLLGTLEAQEAFAMWMALRCAEAYEQRRGDGAGGHNTLRLEFAD
jgi:NCS2 family nucleobase:cation symporter-2